MANNRVVFLVVQRGVRAKQPSRRVAVEIELNAKFMTALRILLVVFSAGCGVYLRAGSITHAAPSQDAAPTAAVPPMPTARRVSALAAALDLNGDGTLSAMEISNAPILLRALDANSDGALSATELRNESTGRRTEATSVVLARTTRPTRLHSSFNLAFVLDANHDGEIQPMEMANAVLSLKLLDINGDGQISGDEMRPQITLVAQAM